MSLANLCGGTAGINLTPSCGGSDHGLWEAWSKIIRFPPRVTCFPPRVAVAEELSVYSVLCTVKMIHVHRGSDRFEVCYRREGRYYCEERIDVQISGAVKKAWEGGGSAFYLRFELRK